MATTLNAGTTTGTALNVITDTSGAMAIQTSGTTAIAISTSQVVTLTNALLPASGGTGITSLGTGVATFLGTPSSANLLAAVTDETGTGSLVFGTSPTIATPTISSPALTGTPVAPTAAAGTNTTQVATTAFVSAIIPAGTVMLFYQAAAPTGWTQVITQNNKALRVVSGTGAGTGGSVGFTTAFASQAVAGTVGTSGATTLTTAQIPSHQHAMSYPSCCSGGFATSSAGVSTTGPVGSTQATGGGGSHTHTGGTFTGTAINLAVQYIDVIIASKN
jgi:hypothetical protein